MKKKLAAALAAVFALGISAPSVSDAPEAQIHSMRTAEAVSLWDVVVEADPETGKSRYDPKSKEAVWECYHCGETATTKAYNPDSPEPRAKPPADAKCPEREHGNHEWVWQSGVRQEKSPFSHFQCKRCGKRADAANPVEGVASQPEHWDRATTCEKASNGEHMWERLPIW